jgi:glutamate formiminotransferase
VQARGFLTDDPNVVQVSMNLLDYRQTSLPVVFERIRVEAEKRGAAVLHSELVGLLPAEALVDVARGALRFQHIAATSVIETRVLEAALGADDVSV